MAFSGFSDLNLGNQKVTWKKVGIDSDNTWILLLCVTFVPTNHPKNLQNYISGRSRYKHTISEEHFVGWKSVISEEHPRRRCSGTF